MMARGWMQAGFVAAAGAGAFVFLLGSGKLMAAVVESVDETLEFRGVYFWAGAFGGAFVILDGLLRIREKRAVDLLVPTTWIAMATMAAIGVIAMGWGERVPTETWWVTLAVGTGCYATVVFNLTLGTSERLAVRAFCLLVPMAVGAVMAMGVPGPEELRERGFGELPPTWPDFEYVLIGLGGLAALGAAAGVAEYAASRRIESTIELLAGATWAWAALGAAGAATMHGLRGLGPAGVAAFAWAGLIFAVGGAIRVGIHLVRKRRREEQVKVEQRLSRREAFFLLVYPVVVISGYLRFATDPLPERVFDGTSKDLKSTAVVATLEDPMPAGKNVIWCSSFEMAWRELRAAVAWRSVKVPQAEELCDRLAASDRTADDFAPGDAYAAVGRQKEGFGDRLARKFPGLPLPQPGSADGLIVYAHLRASVPFDVPYYENDRELRFKDGSGRETPVGSFGVRWRDRMAPLERLRDQVEILYNSETSCAVDLCRTSHPYQIVAALTERGPTLKETLRGLAKKIEEWKPEKEEERRLADWMVLLVPNMNWRIHHEFAELCGRPFHDPWLGLQELEAALQTIEFRLDRSGAQLRSNTRLQLLGGGMRELIFDRPFLIYMKKRKAGEVFFAMWVENAELMEKK